MNIRTSTVIVPCVVSESGSSVLSDCVVVASVGKLVSGSVDCVVDAVSASVIDSVVDSMVDSAVGRGVIHCLPCLPCLPLK